MRVSRAAGCCLLRRYFRRHLLRRGEEDNNAVEEGDGHKDDCHLVKGGSAQWEEACGTWKKPPHNHRQQAKQQAEFNQTPQQVFTHGTAPQLLVKPENESNELAEEKQRRMQAHKSDGCELSSGLSWG